MRFGDRLLLPFRWDPTTRWQAILIAGVSAVIAFSAAAAAWLRFYDSSVLLAIAASVVAFPVAFVIMWVIVGSRMAYDDIFPFVAMFARQKRPNPELFEGNKRRKDPDRPSG